MDTDVCLDELARRQHGLLSLRQVDDLLSRRQLDRRLANGRLVVVRPGVYRMAGAPVTEEQAVMAAVLAAPGAVASHSTAARLWGLDGIRRPGIDVLVVSPARARLGGVREHRTITWDPSHAGEIRGIPVTSVARTLCDLTSCAPHWLVERALDDALRKKIVAIESIVEVHELLAGRGRHRCTVMATLLAERTDGLDAGESAPEVRVAKLLRAAGLPAPVHQHVVRTGGRAYRLDLAYPEVMVGIEYDGEAVHSALGAFHADRARGNDLELAGWTVLRFTRRSTDTVIVTTVRRALRARAA